MEANNLFGQLSGHMPVDWVEVGNDAVLDIAASVSERIPVAWSDK